jgi:kinesin family protein 15
MPQAFRELFEQLDQAIQTIKEQEETEDVFENGIRSAKTEFTASFYEILNEQIFDLLAPQSLDQALSVREDVGGIGVYVEGLREVQVKDPTEALQLFRQGISNRHVASTKMNRVSSRSHAVFVLKVMSEITTYRGITKVKRSKLTVVDLAGSERQSKTGSMGLRLREAAQINKSLSTLGIVINALVDREGGKLKHVPFRDSKVCLLILYEL